MPREDIPGRAGSSVAHEDESFVGHFCDVALVERQARRVLGRGNFQARLFVVAKIRTMWERGGA